MSGMGAELLGLTCSWVEWQRRGLLGYESVGSGGQDIWRRFLLFPWRHRQPRRPPSVRRIQEWALPLLPWRGLRPRYPAISLGNGGRRPRPMRGPCFLYLSCLLLWRPRLFCPVQGKLSGTKFEWSRSGCARSPFDKRVGQRKQARGRQCGLLLPQPQAPPFLEPQDVPLRRSSTLTLKIVII